MSGHDEFNHGQDAFLPGASFDLDNPDIAWTAEDYLHVNYEPYNLDGPMNGDMEIAENNNSILPSVPLQETPTLDRTTHNGAGSVNDNTIETQFSDLPMFASPPPAQTFGAEPVYNMPLVNANQASDQPVHTTLSTQAFYAPPTNSSSPVNHGFNSYHVMGTNNGPTWSPTGADLPQQNLPTTSQSGYPVPPQQQWSGMWHSPFQRASQALAGADAVVSHSNFQPNTAGNHLFAPQPQGGSSNASQGFPHPAAAPARRTLAPKPASDAQATVLMTQDSDDYTKPVPSPAAPEKKETKAKQTGQERKRPTTSKAKKPVTKMPLYNSQLPALSLEDAKKAVTIKLFELKVVNDDWKDVAAREDHFVSEIVKALEVGYRLQAEEHDRLTAEGRTEFTRWQKEHENKVWAYLDDEEVKNPPEYAKACATILFHKFVEAHRSKFVADPGKAISNGSVDVTTKCSERMEAATTAIREYPIVKYDFLRRERLDALLASPRGFVARKSENMFNNYKKKDTSGPVWLEVNETDSAAAPKAKSQRKRKRKESSPPPSDDEDEEEGEDEGQSDDEYVKPTKHTKRR
jgi:hypothetical protein